jgi:uncharacterized protein YggE
MLRLQFSSLICCILALPLPAWSADRSVTVFGTGVIQVPPDEVSIALELKAVDDDLVRVRSNSDNQVKEILDLAQKHGVKPADFAVSSLKLQLSFNDQLKRQFYHVERSMSVKLGVLANLNALLADLLKQRDTAVGEIRFGASRAKAHELEARRLAVADASDTAAKLAELAGLKLGKALRIEAVSEVQRPFVTSVIPVVGKADPFTDPVSRRGNPVLVQSALPAASASSGQVFTAFATATAQAAQAGGGEGAFGLGQIEFTASMTIVYEMTE